MGLYGMRLHTVAVMSETSSTLVRSREANLRAGGAAPPVAYTHATSLTPIIAYIWFEDQSSRIASNLRLLFTKIAKCFGYASNPL